LSNTPIFGGVVLAAIAGLAIIISPIIQTVFNIFMA
jgi:hypothetical protein